jgi:anti-sigma regulatory factor (Ser/Thr protein kinase)
MSKLGYVFQLIDRAFRADLWILTSGALLGKLNSAKAKAQGLWNFPADVCLLVRCHNGCLRLVRSLTGEVCAGTPLSDDDIADLQLAVHEAVTNTIRHGSPHGCEDFVAVGFRLSNAGVVVRVSDAGRGFSVRRASKAFAKRKEVAPGGYGIPMMSRLADALAIRTGRKGTTVTLAKYFPMALRHT